MRDRPVPAGCEWGMAPAPTPGEFEQIRRLAYEKFGLDLRSGKEQLVSARLNKKMRELQCRSFQEYYRLVVEDQTGEALIGLIDALATNHTGFLREAAHFDYLRDVLLPRLQNRPSIEIWSAACSTGEEPYTLAFTVLDRLGDAAMSRIRILATDISTKALGTARRAVYPAERFSSFPPAWRHRFLQRGEGRWKGWYRVKPAIQQMVRFERLNLIEPLRITGAFPVIFCRNVMIYFDRPTQQGVVQRLAERLEMGGHLFIGHAESLTGIRHSLAYVQPAVYRKTESGAARIERTKGT
jgi:chemotaxis protein methyltransferase CheR